MLSFLLLPLYTQFLDPAQFGVIGMLIIVMMLFGPLANLGMTNAIFRRYSMSKDDEMRATVLGTGLASVIASSLVVLAIAAFAAEPIAQFIVGDVGTINLVRLTCCRPPSARSAQFPGPCSCQSPRAGRGARFNIAQVLFTTIPTIWFVVIQEQGVRGVVLGTLLGETLSTISSFFCTVGSFRVGFNRSTWREMLSYGLPFVPHHLQAVALALFGQYMVREMMGFNEAGLFNIASKFATPVVFVVTAVQNSWVAYKFQDPCRRRGPQGLFPLDVHVLRGCHHLPVGRRFALGPGDGEADDHRRLPPPWTGMLYAKGQSPFHAAVSRRYFELLLGGRGS